MIKLTYEGVTVETETVDQAVEIIKGLTAQPSLFDNQPEDGDWVKWFGLVNGKPPVFGENVGAVSLLFRNGKASKYLTPSVSQMMDWEHRGHPLDIVAYKVIVK